MRDYSKKLDLNTLTINNITHYIERYLGSLQQEDHVVPKAALSDVIYYLMKCPDTVFDDYDDDLSDPVYYLKQICDCDDATVRMNLLEALKQSCFKYGVHDSIEDVNDPKYYPASRISMFYKESNEKQPHKMVYKVNFAELEKLKIEQIYVLEICIRMFAPVLVFEGNYANIAKRSNLLNQIVLLTPQTHIRFKTDEKQLFGPNNRHVFLAAVQKATHLHLGGAELDRWTTDDFYHFIETIKSNPNLTSINLDHTNLANCCKDPSKFKYVLQLLELKQLHCISLHRNRLLELPVDERKTLIEAVNKSPIQHIELGLPSHKARLFNRATQPNPTNPEEEKVVTPSTEPAQAETTAATPN